MAGLAPMVLGLWRGAEQARRQVALRGLYTLAAIGLALLGMAFVGVAAHTALRHAVGPVPAALIMAAGLFATASVVMLVARHRGPLPTLTDAPAARVPPAPIDPATLAAFTTAFVIGRALADRLKR